MEGRYRREGPVWQVDFPLCPLYISKISKSAPFDKPWAHLALALRTVYRNARTFCHSRYPLFPHNPGPGTVARPARSATRRPPYYSADRVGSSLFNLTLETDGASEGIQRLA